MNKNSIYILAILILIIAITYPFLEIDKKEQNDIHKKNVEDDTQYIISNEEKFIEKKENKINNDTNVELSNIQKDVEVAYMEESNKVKTIYTLNTVNHQYEILLTSEQNISSKPIGIKYDSGVIVNETIIVYGKIDEKVPYRMLFGRNIVDNANNISFIIKNNISKNIEEVAPTFLYSIHEPGQYKMDIQTSPLIFSDMKYIESKHDMKKILEDIQLKMTGSKNDSIHSQIVEEAQITLKNPKIEEEVKLKVGNF